LGHEDGYKMTAFTFFGDPARFEIAVRWIKDHEPRDKRPLRGGWSMGEMRLTVGNHILTRHQSSAETRDTVTWYLFPVFEWLAENWVSLFHEQRFAWRENSAAPAATATFLALRRWIDAEDSAGQAAYAEVQAWWSRHALRAADASALYPDLAFRRLGDDVEVSWTARQPTHAPDGFRFALTPGAATIAISDVAGPIWEALAWAASTPRDLDADDRKSVAHLKRTITELASLSTADLEKGYLPTKLFQKIETAREGLDVPDTSIRVPSVPAIAQLDDAVFMFGGVSPDIGVADTRELMGLLASKAGGNEAGDLAALVDSSIGAPLSAPFEEGYDLAEQLLEELELPGNDSAVDIHSLLSRLGVAIIEKRLRTSTIRGVAVAGVGYSPAILVNEASQYNATEAGQRFTLAHELFHILYDRAQARRITHTSGPWAPPGIEKRANAFAAMLLMPRDLVRRSLPLDDLNRKTLFEAADSMRVGASALVEHLYNTSVIDEFKRDELRSLLAPIA